MKPKVLLTRALMPEAVELLQADFDLEIGHTERMLTRAELLEKIQGKDAIISMFADKIDRETLDTAQDLKLIANYAVGYNNIDVPATIEKNIPVVHTPDVLTDATADVAFAQLLAVARRIPEAHAYVVEGKFTAWKPDLLLGLELTGKTVGIVGMGRIGRAFARRCLGFGMSILYFSRTRLPSDKEKELAATYVTLEELLRRSDVVSLHVPLTDETRHLIDADKLALLKPDAILINTARGPVVDEPALIKTLKEKRIWGAGLDVYENEPHVPEELRRLDNCVLLPHIGSATREARFKMTQIPHDAIVDFFAGRTPKTLVPEWQEHMNSKI